MKNQLKKSFSLFLAVIMLMSCWVWIAPTEAEAGAPVSYDVVVTTSSENMNACEDTHRIVFYHADGTSTEKNWSNAQNGTAGGETFTITKWPKSIYFQIGSKNVAKARIVAISINGTSIFDGGYNLNATGGLLWENKDSWTVAAGDGQTGVQDAWKSPEFEFDSVQNTLDIPNPDNVLPQVAEYPAPTFEDQYGVTWSGSVTQNEPEIVLKDKDSKNEMTAEKNGLGVKVTANAGADKYDPGEESTSWKLTVSYTSSGKTITQEVDVSFTHPKYTVNFNANFKNGNIDGVFTNFTQPPAGVYGTSIEDEYIPTDENHSRKGYQLAGFNSQADGGGTAFTPLITGNQTWYAMWDLADVDAIFKTADGQDIGTIKAKYGKTLLAQYGNNITTLNNAIAAAANSKIEFDTNNEPVWEKDGVKYQFAGWRVLSAKDFDGEPITELNGQLYNTAVLQGETVFQATYVPKSMKEYTVKFYNATEEDPISTNTYLFGQDAQLPSSDDITLAADVENTYTHVGWASKTGKTKYYKVDEKDKDENGSLVVYTPLNADAFVVYDDAEYVPVFRMNPIDYTISFNYYEVDKIPQTVTVKGVHYGDSLASIVPDGILYEYTHEGYSYAFDYWLDETNNVKLEDATCLGNMTFTMQYKEAVPAVYTINFYDFYGNLINDGEGENQYTHLEPVTAPAVDSNVDTAEALYTFSKFNTKKDGTGADVTSTARRSINYYAVYTQEVYADLYFYNYDGSLIYSVIGKPEGNEGTSTFVGHTIHEYAETTYGTPAKAEDVVGTYNFTGWADDAGKPIAPGIDTFTGDTYLYAQFDTVYKDYTVKFLDDDGTEISKNTYHYGIPIVIPENPVKEEDVEYSYDFRAWDPEVSEVCYGDATYTATYRRTPKYYKVIWLNDDKTVFNESQYMYGSKIQQAFISESKLLADVTGYDWVRDYWVRCDAQGNPLDENGNIVTEDSAAIFTRGTKMGAEHLYFYPVFRQEAKTYTVTFYDETGTEPFGEVKIPYGVNINDETSEYWELFSNKREKMHTEEKHFTFAGWAKNEENGALVESVENDISVKATYDEEDHSLTDIDVLIYPTCTETGLADYYCSNGECGYVEKDVILAIIPDEAAPTGQIYVGLDKWTLSDFATIDYKDVKYVGPTTNVIINATDLGSRGPQNPEAQMNRGVGKIDYYISEETVATSGITEWTNVYNYDNVKENVLHDVLLADGKTLEDYNAYDKAQKAPYDAEVNAIMATYKANVTGILSNIGLENGKEYIIYVRVSDREVNGTSNVCYFSSGKFHYGSTPAEIAITGNGYGTKFCAAATIKVTDDTDGFKTYLNGEEITLTDGEYVCNEKGVHIVEVVDKNGNKTTRSFEIKGNHTYRNYTTAATCENAGSRYDLCTLCGHKANETVLSALGHSYTINYVEKDATCVDDGYRTYTCDNNCGTKIVINPNDSAEKIAQAKKYVVAAEGEEGTWDKLTAEDIAHLKATGLHTYAKVKDENGEDTAEDAWVIDKAATCKVPGSKHKDCTKCGERVTEEIALDTENGHKFYRAKVTTEPTCTTEGERTKTCRYCGKKEVVEAIPALGHTAGEYRVITEPTCTTEGSKILTCSVCGVDIGEPVEDEEATFDGGAVVIPALDHAWKLDGEPYKEVTTGEDGNAVTTWYQNYKCSNAGCEEIDKRVLEDYVEPIAATVTFKNGEKDAAPQVFNLFVGDSIVASDVTEPTKAADATYKYTFSHWATKNADGTYTEATFPIVVAEGGATYYAIYAEKYINYTITYYKEDGITEYKKVGYLHNGEAYDLIAGPAKAETWQYTYKFAGWKVNGTYEVLTDTVTINGADINLTAVYDAVLRKYAVSYAYSWENILETFEVNAGAAARSCAIIPEKAEDSKYHYEFAGWNRAEQLKSVESNIYTTPEFTAIEHEFTESVKAEATCTTNKVVTKTCTCGYSYDVEIANSALGHLWGDPIEVEGGVNIVKCQREGCDASDDDTRTYTVKFFVNADDDKATKTLSYISWGSTIDATRLPADPTKESTSSTEYTFLGWALEGTTEKVDFATYTVTSDATFVAVFEATTREYTVIFAYDAYNTIAVFKNVPAGEDVIYDGATPTKAYDEVAHYEFSNWSGLEEGNNTIENVQGDVYVTAEFDKIPHSYTASELNEATCTNGKGTRYSCECGHYYDVTGKPLPHEYEATANRREPTPTQNGFQEYKCKNCGETYEEELVYADNSITITVTVTHNGAVKSGIRVEVQAIGVDTPFVATTNANGVATFKVDKDYAYNCWVTVNGEKIQIALENGGNGNLVGNYNYTDQGDCTCACHRDNFWGAIFRFFHKIIKLFTGEFKCCGNPDPMYG